MSVSATSQQTNIESFTEQFNELYSQMSTQNLNVDGYRTGDFGLHSYRNYPYQGLQEDRVGITQCVKRFKELALQMANLLKGQPRDQFLEQRTKVGQLVRELQQAVSLSDRTNRCIVEAVANNNMEQFAQLRPNEFADQEKAYVEQAITVKLTGQPTTDMVNTAVEMFLLILGSNTASVDANVRQLMEELIFNQPWGSASRLMCDMLNRVFELHGQYLQNRQADDSVNLNTDKKEKKSAE